MVVVILFIREVVMMGRIRAPAPLSAWPRHPVVRKRCSFRVALPRAAVVEGELPAGAPGGRLTRCRDRCRTGSSGAREGQNGGADGAER